jgi:pimeloyl-ACP methyl ester carboxylesterase
VKGTIVLIHGMWCGPEHWERLRAFLEQRGWRVIAPALRHHRALPPPAALGTTSLLDYAADLEEEIRALGGRPILVGHSMGGLLAQILAARGCCSAAVLLSPAAPWGVFPLRVSVVRSFLSLLLRWRFWRRPHLLTSGEADYALLHRLEPSERRRVCATLRPESGRAIAEIGLWWFDPRRAGEVDAARIRCPVLIVQGAEDRIVPAPVTRRVARRYRAEYRELDGHAHWLVEEPGWEGVFEGIERWIEATALPAERAGG